MFPATIHNITDAPEASRATLEALQGEIGFVPNVFGLYAQSPVALNGLTALNAAFNASSLSSMEREVVALTTSVFNGCVYCVAGHSTFLTSLGLAPASLNRIRDGGFAPEPRLAAIGQFTLALLETRGGIGPDPVRAFTDAGFEPRQVFEVFLGVACKTMTNFAAKASGLPVDAEFADHEWTPPELATSNAA